MQLGPITGQLTRNLSEIAAELWKRGSKSPIVLSLPNECVQTAAAASDLLCVVIVNRLQQLVKIQEVRYHY